VALLPGSHGAVIAEAPEPGKPLSLTLPPAAEAAGRVTIGGKPADGRNGTIRVVAAYEGRGTLNGVLSVNTTARADGSFDLAGLTAGTYRVQAALAARGESRFSLSLPGGGANLPRPLSRSIRDGDGQAEA
jgi:hypothetical protein